MANEKRLIDANDLWQKTFICDEVAEVRKFIENAPTVDAVILPKGKPGDYVLWTNGVCERLFEIYSIMICKDGIRYDLGDLSPFVNHSHILKIMNLASEVQKMANEKRLIDANAYKASLTKWKEDAWKHNERGQAMLIADCLCELETMRTVDAVEVVRCKDCKHWKHFEHLGCTDFVKVCGLANYMIGENGYCLYGERKEND